MEKNSFVAEVTFLPKLAFKFHFIFYFYLLNGVYNFNYSNLLPIHHQPCSHIIGVCHQPCSHISGVC